VLLGACWQAPPTQKPVLPHAPFAPHFPFGSTAPLVTGLQVPLPARLQAWQVPHMAVVQQTPSRQLPLTHSLPAVLPLQVVPLAFFATHAPPAQ
jgi:hypothetical protein